MPTRVHCRHLAPTSLRLQLHSALHVHRQLHQPLRRCLLDAQRALHPLWPGLLQCDQVPFLHGGRAPSAGSRTSATALVLPTVP